jgi:hypothetical protein
MSASKLVQAFLTRLPSGSFEAAPLARDVNIAAMDA